jgi:hypothetical protein
MLQRLFSKRIFITNEGKIEFFIELFAINYKKAGYKLVSYYILSFPNLRTYQFNISWSYKPGIF